ncbi:MAG: SAP domain-containing protein [Terracidiphilus sp.]
MGWFDRWLGRKLPSSSQESISKAQLVPANWASSQPHLALLKRFLSARDTKDGFPDYWAPAFGMSPQCVIDGMVAHGALETLPLLEKIEFCHTVAELRKILSSRGLKVSGKKAELVQRLLEADPKGMEKLCAHRMILRCTPAASQAVSRWEAERAQAFETATDDVIAALRNRHFKAAICIADAYQKSKFEPPFPPAQEAMTIHPAPRSIEERENDLATVFTMRPKILEGLQPEQWEGIYLNYAVWQLLGRVAPDECMPGFTGIGAMNLETATRMLSFHVRHQRDLARWRELGINRATIIGVGGCEACLALINKTFSLDKLPELPYKDCTCGLGCRCTSRPVLPY